MARGHWIQPAGLIRSHSHEHGCIEPRFGLYKAGNDCDASELDFRATEVVDEGWVDAMSTDSPCSLRPARGSLKRLSGLAVRAPSETEPNLCGFGMAMGRLPSSFVEGQHNRKLARVR